MSDPAATTEHAFEHRYTPLRVIEIVQTVLTALMLAFIFRAYFIEAFIIPTGSMASGLTGDHSTRVCPTCGWAYDFGPMSSAFVGTDHVFRGGARVRCPNCHDIAELEENQIISKAGDRILVHKWPYLLSGPQRWDVVVFRDPADPQQSFIKRLVGLPGEEIEIIDGDVYTRGPTDDEVQIRRKTLAAQSSLWTIVFDQNSLPRQDDDPSRNARWIPDLEQSSLDGHWSGYDTREISYECSDDLSRRLRFAPLQSPYYLQDMHGYNGGTSGGGDGPPYVGDARLRFTLTPEDARGSLTIALRRDGRQFHATLDFAGRASLETVADSASDDRSIWQDHEIPQLVPGRPVRVEFSHLDYRVSVTLDDQEILASNEQQYRPNPPALRDFRRTEALEFSLLASGGGFRLGDLRIDRDVHYSYSRNNTLRAYANSPFALRQGEYFVLGDNTAYSHDGREWYRVGPHLELDAEAGRYRIGTVRYDQIVGQAFFVYLPGLLPIDEAGRFRIPDLGRVRFVR